VHGGDSYSKTSIYETTTNAWTPGSNLQIGRGYQVKPKPYHVLRGFCAVCT
jgi:hypothetical protein